jgi:hypothetical protein
MLKELLLEVPSRLKTTGKGQIAGPVRLANHDAAELRCTCRFETADTREATLRFAADGLAEIQLPEDLTGTLLAVLELAEPYGGARLIGAFQMTVEPGRGKSERGVVYQALSSRGTAASGALMADKVMLRIPLVAERPSRAVPLSELIDRERCLPLSDRGDGTARVITIHAGESTVLGRCYASQLRGQARGFLDALGENAIHWVTLWDDRWVNKLSARFQYRLEKGRQNLLVRNVTDYSQASNDLRIVSEGLLDERVRPGQTVSLPIDAQNHVTVLVGEGEHQRELVSCRFLEACLGKLKVRIPLFKTEKTEFRFPPEDPAGLRMHYLGIWLPLPLERFEHLLTLAQEPLAIAFPREAVYFWIRYRHARGLLTVSSNEDLRERLTAQ